MKKILEVCFWIALAVFMLLGAAVVFWQLVGVIFVQPTWVTVPSKTLSTVAFSASTACALFAFVLQYFMSSLKDDGVVEDEI
ncbi:MAG: hypothetical protein L0G99_00895 [Propionibacteriales bacterium]|nr:hypothetical protein [Propionibacteriales bacterium]